MTTARVDIHSTAYQKARAKTLETATNCIWCGREISDALPRCHPAKATADHFPPRRFVGDHLNLVPACHTCNSNRTAERVWKQQFRPSRRW